MMEGGAPEGRGAFGGLITGVGMTFRRFCGMFALMIAPAVAAGAEGLAIDRGVGRPVADFKLKDTSGKPASLYGLYGHKAAVLVFTGADCPVGKLYMARLAELAEKYEAQGVAFLAIDSNSGADAKTVAESAREHGVKFPVLLDPGNVVADVLLAERTCETLIVDAKARLRYRGAIDDQYDLVAHKDAPTRTYVADALDAILADGKVEVSATPVAGCPIERSATKVVSRAKLRHASPEVQALLKDRDGNAEVGPVTYAGEVASILQEKCQACHRPGQVGPFSLLSYDDARRHATSIREVVDDLRMPPWHADPRHGAFQNDRSLSARQRAILLAWVDQGMPLGDPERIPAAKAFPEGWTIGTPDAIFELPEPYTVSAQGILPYQRFRVPTNFQEDKWVQAAEARPGDRAVVHHIIVYVDDHSGENRRKADGHLCGYAPGDMPLILPAGAGKRVPAGSDLVFEVHYTPIGVVKVDRSKVGLIFCKEPPTHRAITRPIAQHRFAIPPGAENYAVESSMKFERDAHLLGFMPHMHLRGKDFRYTATFPDGKAEVLLSVPAYDFSWQSAYRLAESRAMPKGTRIDCLAHFDNSAGNAANPTRPRPSPGAIRRSRR